MQHRNARERVLDRVAPYRRSGLVRGRVEAHGTARRRARAAGEQSLSATHARGLESSHPVPVRHAFVTCPNGCCPLPVACVPPVQRPYPERCAPVLRKSILWCVAALMTLAVAVLPARAGVILSELCDPLNGYTSTPAAKTDRFIEIYNVGPGAVDLTGWSVVAIANGADVTTWALSGTIPAGQARVCGCSQTNTVFQVDYTSAQWGTAGYFNWNGKVGDGAKLVAPGNVIVDLINVPGQVFTDGDLVRNASVTAGSPSYVATEWTFTAVTTVTQASPGTHNGSAPPPPGPVIANVVTSPAAPAAGDPVHVFASVVDTAGAITSVSCNWGTTSGSLTNVIPMSNIADSTYQTDYTITAAVAGATVYYRVSAVGPHGTSQSSVLSYTIPGGGGGGGTPGAPTISAVGEMSDSTLLVFFSEPVDPVTSQAPANYVVDGGRVAVAAVRDPVRTEQVLITVRGLTAGSRTLTVNGVADVGGTTAFGITKTFNYIDVTIPAGYYNGTAGLKGSALRKQLHLIIRNHIVKSYAFVLTAYSTTDIKPNGKIWDVYSDVPGGTPPYEYAYGQTGQGAGEGFGYNREHSFPQSWFNSASPMDSDIHHLFPTDAYVNGMRANYPYGVVGTPTKTSLNGCKLGNSVTPGYTGVVFEPIDEYKGDLARGQFYMATRYFGQDGSWPGSPSFNGAEMQPWAVAQYKTWAQNDPPSWKDRMRNAAVYAYQGNRNPFVDHPEFITAIYDSNNVSGVEPGVSRPHLMLASQPSPFVSRTTLAFQLPQAARVSLRVFDVGGRLVRTLADGAMLEPGTHTFDWDGTGDGASTASGLYFVRLDAGGQQETIRTVRMR